MGQGRRSIFVNIKPTEESFSGLYGQYDKSGYFFFAVFFFATFFVAIIEISFLKINLYVE